MGQMPPAPGKLVDVNGHRLHVYAMSEGSPTVVFESGGASWSLDWYLVQSRVAKFAATCSYDRAGFGWSDLGPKPRTAGQIAGELHALLEKAEVKKPYLFVGASFGGHIVRLFAKRYPSEVIGMVLVDARHEAINQRMPAAWRELERTGKALHQFLLLASRIGALSMLGKLMGEKAAPPIVSQLPAEIRPLYLAVGFQPKYFQSNLDELAAIGESDVQVSLAGSLDRLPLAVIRHGIPDLFSSMPIEQASEAERVWQGLQAELVQLSSDGQLLVAAESGHAIPIVQPDIVVEAVRQVLSRVGSRNAG